MRGAVAVTRIKWPVALATFFLILLGWYLLYTGQIRRALQADAETRARIYTEVQRGLAQDSAGVIPDWLWNLQGAVRQSGVPLILTVRRGGVPGLDSVTNVENLPFEVDLDTEEGQNRVLSYVRRLDRTYAPVGDSALWLVHFGETPETRNLRWIPWLQVAGLLLTVIAGFTLIRAQRRAESERAWTAMARELAHQLGTPLSSLQGWLEVLRLDREQRPGGLQEGEIAAAIEEDLVRLERISHRFELIGREPKLEPTDLNRLVEGMERYLRARLPQLGPGVELKLDVPQGLPRVQANEVLLVWALENVVKNALDALAGTGGTITVSARQGESGWLSLYLHDTGPGVDFEVRDRIFEPGVTTKSGGWGVGLALSRRIVEGVHGGRIELLDGRDGGATFHVRLPTD